MEDLRRSPFKVATIENDPKAFGRRIEDIRDCATALYNGRHILISGPRGIGKSSLGTQLQIAYDGIDTLLRRCLIETRLPRFLCAFFACDSTTSLAELCSEVLFALERRFLLLKVARSEKVKISVELDLKFVKAKIESELTTRRPATLATELVVGLTEVLRSSRLLGLQGLNIMIDELDLLPKEINVGHFLKVVHETLGREGLTDVTFILAGQRGIYPRLIEEDRSVERHLRHVPISVLAPDEARYVLEFAADHASPPFPVSREAADMILSIAAGYPYDIHLIGDAAFTAMEPTKGMQREDVLRGLSDLFRSDKREKYLQRLRDLNANERLVVVSLARYSDRHVPMRIPLEWLADNLIGQLNEGAALDTVLQTLARDGHLILRVSEGVCHFGDELFRIFTSLLLMDQREARARRLEHGDELAQQRAESERDRAEARSWFLTGLDTGVIDDKHIDRALEALGRTEFDPWWEDEDHSGLTRFRR